MHNTMAFPILNALITVGF